MLWLRPDIPGSKLRSVSSEFIPKIKGNKSAVAEANGIHYREPKMSMAEPAEQWEKKLKSVHDKGQQIRRWPTQEMQKKQKKPNPNRQKHTEVERKESWSTDTSWQQSKYRLVMRQGAAGVMSGAGDSISSDQPCCDRGVLKGPERKEWNNKDNPERAPYWPTGQTPILNYTNSC